MNPLFTTLSRCIPLAQGSRSQKSSARASAARTRQRTRLCLETLEDRTVPSASISVANASLNEIGSPSADPPPADTVLQQASSRDGVTNFLSQSVRAEARSQLAIDFSWTMLRGVFASGAAGNQSELLWLDKRDRMNRDDVPVPEDHEFSLVLGFEPTNSRLTVRASAAAIRSTSRPSHLFDVAVLDRVFADVEREIV